MATLRLPALRRVSVDLDVIVIWTLGGGLVLYLAVNSGGYDLAVHSRIGVIVWWSIFVAALCGVLPPGRLTRSARGALALFTSFVVWTAVASTWSLSSERSLVELSRVITYFGVFVFVLAVMCFDERRSAMRRVIPAVASAVVVVAILALLSRLEPGLFLSARAALPVLRGAYGRLSWPLDYWNALAALMALGVPLLLTIATSATTLRAQALAAAGIPVTCLCAFFTFSRGGEIEIAAAVIVFLALAPDRVPKVGTLLVCAVGSAVVIAVASRSTPLEQGLTDSSARHEGAVLLVVLLAVCAATAAAQIVIAIGARARRPGGRLEISRRRALQAVAVVTTVGVIVALAVGAPARVSHAWSEFKRPQEATLKQVGIGRFAVTSSNNRYAYWKVAIAASSDHVLTGAGPGTFQLLWLPRAPTFDYVENAHSLYVETYAEVGLIGLALLVGFLLTLIFAGLCRVRSPERTERARAAGIVAACVAFLISAAVDWVWQMPVLPIAMLILAASVLVPGKVGLGRPSVRAKTAKRVLLAAGAIAGLVAIGVPLATATAVDRSQAAAAEGDTTSAFADARSAIRLEPGASSPRLQAALVLELRGDLNDAITAAQQAIANEPVNWQSWLVLSRLEAESGHAAKAVGAFRRARQLNPQSPLFAR